MKLKEISKTRSKKLAKNYNSIGYSVSITADFEEGDVLNTTDETLNELLLSLSILEEKRLKLFIENQAKVQDNELTEALKPLPEKSVEPNKPEVNEAVFDFTDVEIIAETEKSFLVKKEEYQTWVALSNIKSVVLGEAELPHTLVTVGNKLSNIILTDKADKWLPKKAWDPFKPRDGG